MQLKCELWRAKITTMARKTRHSTITQVAEVHLDVFRCFGTAAKDT